jgi:hypothetical protein
MWYVGGTELEEVVVLRENHEALGECVSGYFFVGC